MNRKDLLQQLIDNSGYRKYLEIGVFNGKTFLPLKCRKKIAVDPLFRISNQLKRKWNFSNLYNLRNDYYEVTSDYFFNSGLADKTGPFDLIFIDGLHTFEASLKDALNSMAHLKPGGTIVFHDCFPPHKAASTPAHSFENAIEMEIENWTGEWCGDVWKTIYYLKQVYTNKIQLFVVNSDYGLGVLKIKSKYELNLKLDQKVYQDINKLTFEFLNSNPEKIINLKKIEVINDFFEVK